MLRSVTWIMALVLAGLTMADNINAVEKTSVLKGTVYIGDKSHPLSRAEIMLLDEKKTSNSDHTVDTKADENGDYKFAEVAEGRYTISIRAQYEHQEDAPCKLLMGKTRDKDSTVMVARDHGKYVEQIFIKGFSVKGGKDIDKDFDVDCKSMFGG